MQACAPVPARPDGRARPVTACTSTRPCTGAAISARCPPAGPQPRLRPIRHHPLRSSRPTTRVPVPRSEWVPVAVPALVDPAVAEAARMQLEENRRRKREQCRGPGWLLQGLVVCRRCGYAYYGKSTPGLAERHRPSPFGYGAYRCIGSDGHRFQGKPVCTNRPVRSDRLERTVWTEVEAILNDPARVAHEYQQRLAAVSARVGSAADLSEAERRIATLRRGIGRLIDGYAEGVIERSEFEPRIADLRGRVAQLEEQRKEIRAASEAERELTLIVGQLEHFSARVRENLDLLDWTAKRDVLRLMVRRIEIDDGHIEIVFRVPPAPPSGPDQADARRRQRCTAGRRPAVPLGGPVRGRAHYWGRPLRRPRRRLAGLGRDPSRG